MLRKLHVLKAHSPFSMPLVIREVLGNWTYLLSDGKVWNARRIKHYYDPALQWATVEVTVAQLEERLAPLLLPFRRSTRITKGFPAQRYTPK